MWRGSGRSSRTESATTRRATRGCRPSCATTTTGSPPAGSRPTRLSGGPLLLPPELREVDRALLDERVPPPHGLLGLVVEIERRMGKLCHTRTLLCVVVDGFVGLMR